MELKNKKVCYINFLPNEILWKIFDDVPTENILKYRLVQKRWYDICSMWLQKKIIQNSSNITKWMKEEGMLCFFNNQSCEHNGNSCIKARRKQSKKYRRSSYVPKECDGVFNIRLRTLLRLCNKTVTDVGISECGIELTSRFFKTVAKHCPNLKKLRVNCNVDCGDFDEDDLQVVGKLCPNLQVLDLINCQTISLKQICAIFKKLEVIRIPYILEFNNGYDYNIRFDNFPKTLLEFTLGDSYFFHSFSGICRSLANNCPKLETINTKTPFGLSNEDLELLANGSIKSLSVFRFSSNFMKLSLLKHLKKVGMFSFNSNFDIDQLSPALEHIHIDTLGGSVSPQYMSEIINCPKLKMLRVSPNVCEKWVRILARKCPLITSLELHSTENLAHLKQLFPNIESFNIFPSKMGLICQRFG